MRSLRFLLITFALFVCLHTVTAAPRYAVARRQDDSESTPAASSSIESSRPSSTNAPRESSTARSVSDRHSTTEESAASSTTIVSSSTTTAPSTTPSSSASTNGTTSAAESNDPLPLHPKITPALGLIGALFLISGALYAVVGIKNKWLYIGGSAAYLAALAVTVLIIYLMSPPVSNAVQSGFFVAAFFSGVVFGGLALIFSDLTEGLGCLLGGFCLSMWFLSLKDGGLITSTAGRAIFIGCLSVAGYCLSFSRYTRTYGLIGSISFSGATIAMLGVDCFSRAGWKEFWLYLWNLNPDVFPLNTNTYPMTKGLRAELAGVVIVCAFGVISQLRVWKLIKERRAKREEHEQEKAELKEEHEAELGRTIEDKFQKERQQWEATYGEKRSSDESSQATQEKEYADSVYGSKAELAQSANKQAAVFVVPVQEDEIEQIDASGAPITQDGLVVHSTDISRANSRANSARPSSELVAAPRMSQSISTASSLKPSARPPPPVVVPLPFRIPQEDDAKSELSDNASVSAIPDTEHEEKVLVADQQLVSRRSSGQPTMKRLSTARSSVDGFQAEEIAMMSQDEDDRRSSVAATLDEEDRISLPASQNNEMQDDDAVAPEKTAPDTPKIDVQTAEASEHESNEHLSVPSPSRSALRQSLTISTDPKPDDARSKHTSVQSPRLRHDTLVNTSENSQASGSAKSDAMSQNNKAGSVVADLSTALPARLSKVAQSYRTNEWAKHLETAEKPEIDDISEPSSPGAQLDHERPAPVGEGIAQPFAVAKRVSRRISSDSNVHRNNTLAQINSSSARQSQELLSPTREASQIRDKTVRASVLQQLSPSKPDFVSRRISSGPAQSPERTLLGKRESLIRNRVSTQNFNHIQPPTPAVISTNDRTAAADEDMTLAQRRRALKHQKPPSASQKWQKSSWAVAPQIENFDSHQPKRTVGSGSEQKREELLAGWRGSMQQNTPNAQIQTQGFSFDSHQPNRTAGTGDNAKREQLLAGWRGSMQQPAGEIVRGEEQRAAMMNAKRQMEMEKQQEAMVAQQRESMRNSRMRSSEMLDAHREAMRRMQASANRNA